ncbi:2Fe-2S iron-sulfur cluster-binding protein [Kineosporia sp. NBRC 101731]|uniref:pyridoxamine 5'-phosphate oxidase family protein n=1 Tax=Kineosporia sp. NBRC 101731 TaxID=3032199 RepID=UPI0024A066DB|nr:2Fe-2S iron-sulfur cluster-binding protein [Kineosporia sp. NBRC 101731]GLY30859.1 hypothetical protein Kisp02_42240 [Kineosporia sp. NBRC 101731]
MTTEIPGERLTTTAFLTTPDEIAALLGKPVPAVMMKQIDHLDPGAVSVLRHSPIAGAGYRDTAGSRRSTFVGGDAGFLEVLTPTRIAFSLPETSPVPANSTGFSFVFLLPGVSETLRLNGLMLSRDGARTVVRVQEVYVHCARAIGRSQLWVASHSPAPSGRNVPGGSGPLNAPGVREFLAAAPFLVCTSGDADGGSDTSPRGDRPGFVRVIDGHTIAIPDRKGNRRADTFHNLLQDPQIALAALVPGSSQVLHLNGTASVTTDPDLLSTMALRGMSPHAALLIDVAGVELGVSVPVRDAHLWDATAHVDRDAFPDLNILAAQHLATNPAHRWGLLIRPVAALLKLFPNVTRRLIGRSFSSALAQEGYDSDSPAAVPTPPRRASTPARRFEVSAIRRETPDAVTIVLRGGDEPLDFAPGQFFTFGLDVDGTTVRRAYSASCAPGSPELEITVKHIDDGIFSSHLHRKLAVGDQIEVRGPSGALFDPAPADTDEIVMVAAGSGVTPMMSIIRARLAGPGRARLMLLYGNRDETSIIFAGELARLQREHPGRLVVTHQLTGPEPTWTGRTGRITGASLTGWLATVHPSPEARYYLCGPDTLMNGAREVLREHQILDDRIRLESYRSAAPPDPSGTAHRMNVTDGGAEIGAGTVPAGQTLLEAGLAAGLPMPYSCTVGNCGECVVKLLSGRVTMSEPHCLPVGQEAEGYVLTCVGRAQTDVTLDIADL